MARSAHAPLQIDCPVGHDVTQLPDEHRALPPVGAAVEVVGRLRPDPWSGDEGGQIDVRTLTAR